MRWLVAALGLTACLLGCGGSATAGRGRAAAARDTAVPAAVERESFNGTEYAAWNLPRWAAPMLHDSGFHDRYELFLGLNPYFLTARLDGDDSMDVAIQILERATRKRGLVIIHWRDRSLHVLGAGNRLGNGGDDFQWLWVWRVAPPAEVDAPALRGREALYLEKPEAAGGYVYWNGATYLWRQAGD